MRPVRRFHTLMVGGTRGIGRAVVRHFAEEGNTVSVIGRSTPPEVRLPGVHHYSVDLADTTQLTAVLPKLVRQNGPLTNLIFLQRFRGQGDPWQGELEVSLTSTMRIIEALRDQFTRSGGASIVLVGSNAGRLIADEQPVGYHVAKGGLCQLMRYYACTLGPSGTRVNCVSPGTVLKAESKEFFLSNKPLQSLYRRLSPLSRMGTSEDVAGVIGFLCSAQAAFVTGQDIVVDGGFSLLLQESLIRRAAPGTSRRDKREGSRS